MDHWLVIGESNQFISQTPETGRRYPISVYDMSYYTKNLPLHKANPRAYIDD